MVVGLVADADADLDAGCERIELGVSDAGTEPKSAIAEVPYARTGMLMPSAVGRLVCTSEEGIAAGRWSARNGCAVSARFTCIQVCRSHLAEARADHHSIRFLARLYLTD